MHSLNRCAKINLKILVVLAVVIAATGVSLFAARHLRRRILSKMDFDAGNAAFDSNDWSAASKHFAEYLGRNPDDIEILKKLAESRMSTRPIEARSIAGAIAAYRRVLQLEPEYETAYEKLAVIYRSIGKFEELAYISENRPPEDIEATLRLAEAWIRLDRTEDADDKLDDLIDKIQNVSDKGVEYARACIMKSDIARGDVSAGAGERALDWLKKTVDHAPTVEALVHRARFYRETPGISDMDQQERLAAARKDLETADSMGTEDPRLRLAMGVEWMFQGELGKVAAEMRAVESVSPATLEEYYWDLNNWFAGRFLLDSELAIRTDNVADANALADDVLSKLREKRHRVLVLPSAIRLYVAAGKVLKARKYLDEYTEALHAEQATRAQEQRLAYIQALVASVEQRPYAVIDIVQLALANDASSPQMWRLLADAYSRTDQTRRAVTAITQYLRLYPADPQMSMALVKEYLKLGDWSRAFVAANLAENQDSTDVRLKLLRIESGIYATAEQRQDTNAGRYEQLSGELAGLRQKHPDRVDIRILQAIIALNRGDPNKAEE